MSGNRSSVKRLAPDGSEAAHEIIHPPLRTRLQQGKGFIAFRRHVLPPEIWALIVAMLIADQWRQVQIEMRSTTEQLFRFLNDCAGRVDTKCAYMHRLEIKNNGGTTGFWYVGFRL